MKDLMMVSYVHPKDLKTRYRQSAYDVLPPWAFAVQDEIPTADEIVLLQANQAKETEPVGEIVVTKDSSGEIVAVTRQDEEGRVLKVIATTSRGAQRRMYIPEIGDHVKLAEPWAFRLFDEYRNASMFEHLALPDPRASKKPRDFAEVELPAGTELGVDRVYIRRGNAEFSSITFNLIGYKKPKGSGLPSRVRFWAKLEDVNRMVFFSATESQKLEL
jgi:hypothetical protein